MDKWLKNPATAVLAAAGFLLYLQRQKARTKCTFERTLRNPHDLSAAGSSHEAKSYCGGRFY